MKSPFVWGKGGRAMTPEDVERERELVAPPVRLREHVEVLHRHAEGGDLSRGGRPRHDLVHRPRRLSRRELRSSRQPAQDLRP